jgi:excisionase family DNA binding protein
LERKSAHGDPEFVSVGFAAKRCGVSNTTVLRWITTGRFPAFRLPGGHFRINKEDFSAFMTKYHIPQDIEKPENNNPSGQ